MKNQPSISRTMKKSSFKQAIYGISIFFLGVGFGIGIDHLDAYQKKTVSAVNFSEASSNLPTSFFPINRSAYSLAYDARTRNPSWVYEKITSDSLKGEVNRDNFQFKEDPNIPKIFRSTLQDYHKQGFDRGHLAPAANHKSSSTEMGDTFYLTNICPQCPKLNRGYWAKLERYVRDLTHTHSNVSVITGPLYMPKTENDGNKYVKYQVIGKNNVAVPTHFFKVVNLETFKGNLETLAYILPNEEISPTTPLDDFKTTINAVEKAAGISFSKQGNP